MEANKPSIQVRLMMLTETAQAPRYAHPGDAGMDIFADCDLDIGPGEYGIVSTGFALGLPAWVEAQVRPRSGLAAKYGVTVLNTPGTIDATFRGEVRVILINHGKKVFEVRRGNRIAQMVIAAVRPVEVTCVSMLDETARGSGGFGSTGA